MINNEGFIEVAEGIKLHYQIIGNSADTVIVPAGSLLAQDLTPLSQKYRLVLYDSRGRGRSDRDPNPDHIWTEYEVDDLEMVRQHFGLDQVMILGWSYWGAVAALYAAKYPTAVSRMIMVCPLSPYSPAPFDDPDAVRAKEQSKIDATAAASLREMMKNGMPLEKPEEFCREFQRILQPRQMGNPAALQQMKSDPCACSNEWWHNLREHNALHFPVETRSNYDLRAQMSQVQARTLIIHGTEDLIPLASSNAWQKAIPQASLAQIEGAGHYPHIEYPDQFFDIVEKFLAG